MARPASGGIGRVRYNYCSQPIPDESRVTLRYPITLDATASVGIYTYDLALNDVHDPDITGVGAQPAYYDQWNALYNRWVVPECEYDVAVTSRTISGRLSVAAVPVVAPNLAPPTFEAAAALRYAKAKETTGGGPTVHIKGTVNMSKLYGVPDYAIEADDAFSGGTSTSPSRRMVLRIACETSGSSDSLSLTIVMKYRVRFFQPLVYQLSLLSGAPAIAAAVEQPCTFTRGGTHDPRPALKPETDEPYPRIGVEHERLCTCGCMRRF